MLRHICRLFCAATVMATGLAAASHAQDWGSMATVSTTMGVNDGRVCIGEASRGDIGCPSNAPYVSATSGFVGIGTDAPLATLDVRGKSILLANSSGVSGSDSPRLRFVDTISGTVDTQPVWNFDNYRDTFRIFREPNLTTNGTAYFQLSAAQGANFNTILRSTGSIVSNPGSGEGGQFVLGYAGVPNLYGQSASGTWNIDVTAANRFRIFRSSPSGTLEVFSISETAGHVGIMTSNPTAALEVSGTVSATQFIGDGSQLTGVVAATADRIVSGTTSLLAVSSTGFVSLTQAGTNTGWFDPTRGLVTLGVSSTGGISATTGYFSGNVGIGKSNPSNKLEVAGTIWGQAIAGNGDVLYVGNDAKLVDINYSNFVGIYGMQSATVGGLKLGSSGGTIFGYNDHIGIGTLSPTVTLDVNGNIRATSWTLVNSTNAAPTAPLEVSGTISGTQGFFGTANIGQTATAGIISTTSPLLRVNALGDANIAQNTFSNGGAAFSSRLMLNRSRGTGIDSFTIVQSGDNLGNIHFGGADGSTLQTAAVIQGVVDGAPGSGVMPGRLNFLTTSGTTLAQRMTIRSVGTVGIGTSTPTTALEVSGTVSATRFIGDGSQLTGVVSASDRITSGSTLLVAVSNTGFISLTQAGTNTGWFDPTRGLVTLGVSSTGTISGTQGYFNNLQVNGTILAAGSSGGVFVADRSNYVSLSAIYRTNNITRIWDNTGGGSDRIVINNTNGNVGIGNNVPTAMLHFANSVSTVVSQTNMIRLWDSPSQGKQFGFGLASSQLTYRGDNHVFYTAADSNTLPRVIINASGDVGIGTQTPTVALEVSGTVSATRFVGDGSQLTGVVSASDRITSGTTLLVAVSNTGFISLTQAGTNTGWFDPTRGLVTLGVSTTGRISATDLTVRGTVDINIGTASTIIGQNTNRSGATPNNVVALGNSAAQQNSGSTVTAVGNYAGQFNNSNDLAAVGYAAAMQNKASGVTAIGNYAGQYNSGNSVSAFGFAAAANNSGTNVTAVGYAAAQYNSSSNVVALGTYAAQYNTTNFATAIGNSAGSNNSGNNFTAVGLQAGNNNTGNDLTAVGLQAATYNTGHGVSALGYLAGFMNTGSNTTALGRQTLQGNSGQYVTALGTTAGFKGGVSNTHNNVTLLGYNAQANKNNQVVLGDSNVVEVSTAGVVLASGVSTTGGISTTWVKLADNSNLPCTPERHGTIRYTNGRMSMCMPR